MEFKTEAETIKEFVVELKPKNVLEVGCNFGRELKLLENLTKIYGIDKDIEKIIKAKENIKQGKFYTTLAKDLPFKNSFFDLVYSSGCLSHNEPKELPSIVSEMLRVSKKYILFLEYLGTRANKDVFSNCKKNTWIHDYDSLFLGKDVIVCFNRNVTFGVDMFHILLLQKEKLQVKVEYVQVLPVEKVLFQLNFWKFKFKVLR